MSVTVLTRIKKKTPVLSTEVMKESDYPGIGQHEQIF